MNYPALNQRLLKQLHEMASTDWAQVTHANESAKQAVKMEAALKLVLLFHSGSPWNAEKSSQWHNLMVECGKEFIGDIDATTRNLCDTIREVLGMKEEGR